MIGFKSLKKHNIYTLQHCRWQWQITDWFKVHQEMQKQQQPQHCRLKKHVIAGSRAQRGGVKLLKRHLDKTNLVRVSIIHRCWIHLLSSGVPRIQVWAWTLRYKCVILLVSVMRSIIHQYWLKKYIFCINRIYNCIQCPFYGDYNTNAWATVLALRLFIFHHFSNVCDDSPVVCRLRVVAAKQQQATICQKNRSKLVFSTTLISVLTKKKITHRP